MPPKLKTALKALAYIAFFIAALVLFVIVTLPLDALEDYLVRKASDEHGADLEITELSMWGLSGLQLEGVTLTPRPSPEEVAEMRAAREARAAWEARQKGAEGAAGSAPAADGGAGAPATGAPTAGAPAAGTPAAGAPAAGAPGVPPAGPGGDPAAIAAAARAARGKTGAGADPTGAGLGTTIPPAGDGAVTGATAAAQADAPPPVPPGPQPLFIESLRVRVALMKLLGDLTDGQVFNEEAEAELEAVMLGGTIEARLERTLEHIDITASVRGLDLSRLTGLSELLPLPLVGGFDGEIDIEVPLDDAGRFRFASTSGAISLTMSDAVIGPGRIEAEGLRNMGGFFDVPRLRLDALGGKINFEQRRATFEEFAFRGKDLEGGISGFVQLANNVELFNPMAYLRFKFSDEFLEREKGIGALMRTVPEIKRGTGGDGFTGFRVSLNAGTKRLAWRPAPRDPFGARPAPGAAPDRGTPTVQPGRGRIPRPTSRPPRMNPVPRATGTDEMPTVDDVVEPPPEMPLDEPIEPIEPVEPIEDEGKEGEGEGEGEE